VGSKLVARLVATGWKVARPERFELPTFWFVAVAARELNNMH